MIGSKPLDVTSRGSGRWWAALSACTLVVVGCGLLALAGPTAVVELGAFAPVALVGTQAATVVAVPVPAWPITVAAVVLYGPWAGFGLSFAGTVAGSVVAHQLGSRFGLGANAHGAGFGGSDGLWLVPLLALPIPVGGDVGCFVAGLRGVRFRRFVVLACVGRVPGTTLGVLTASGAATGSLTSVVVAVALLLVLLLVARRWRANRRA